MAIFIGVAIGFGARFAIVKLRLPNWAIMSGFARVASCAAKEAPSSCGELFQHI
jgi:hypothetical protein